MNVYDFDKTIYNGDSTFDFYKFCLKRHKGIVKLFPSLAAAYIRYYIFRRGTKTQFKQTMFKFLRYASYPNDLDDFWELNSAKIKTWYLKIKQSDDLVISASPQFLLEPICKRLGIQPPIASDVKKETGVYSGINCRDKEKVRRFLEKYPNGRIDSFYSDGKSDAPLARIAEKAYLVKGDKLVKWKF